MGFAEDDRIRHKNKRQNEAFEIYESLTMMGYSPKDIIRYAELALSSTENSERLAIFPIVISIAKKVLNEE